MYVQAIIALYVTILNSNKFIRTSDSGIYRIEKRTFELKKKKLQFSLVLTIRSFCCSDWAVLVDDGSNWQLETDWILILLSE